MNWNPSPWFLAETNHLLAACIVIVLAAWKKKPLFLTAGIFLVFAGLKEFWADFTWLEHDSVLGSTMDFVLYSIGLVSGLLATRWLWIGVALASAALLGLALWDIFAPLTEPL